MCPATEKNRTLREEALNVKAEQMKIRSKKNRERCPARTGELKWLNVVELFITEAEFQNYSAIVDSISIVMLADSMSLPESRHISSGLDRTAESVAR